MLKSDVEHARRALRWSHDGGAPTEVDDVGSVLDQRPNGDSPVVWSNLKHAETQQLHDLAPKLHLDDEALEDIDACRERPKLEVGPDVAVLVTRWVSFDPQRGRVDSRPVSAVLGDDVLVTVIDEAQFLDEFGHRLHRRRSRMTTAFLLHELLDEIVDQYSDALDAMSDVIDDLAERVFDDSPLSRSDQRLIFQLRRSLTKLRRLVMPMEDIASTLTNAARANSDDDDSDWIASQLPATAARGFADIADHALHIAEGVDGLRDVMESLVDTNLSLADVQLNTVMKKLAAWAAIIAVPTAVTGFFGMNLLYPGFGTAWGFGIAVAIIVVAVVVLIFFFRRRGWL